MRKIKYLIIGFFLIHITSCFSKKTKESEKTVMDFFEVYNDGNIDLMLKKYDGIKLFDSYYKSDSIQLLTSKKIDDSIVTVKVKNFFTNGFGKKSIKEILFYVSQDSIGEFSRIIDSKGLTDHSEHKFFDFAKKVGSLKKEDSTDTMKNTKLKKAEILFLNLKNETLIHFFKNVIVLDWSWKSGYSGSASGKGIVKNNTSYDIPNVKYLIKYLNEKGNVITTDDGYVSYDKINSGEAKTFTFYTSYIGVASRARINLEFDDESITDYLLNSKKYTGREYEEHLNNIIK